MASDDIKERGINELNPIWNVMDLTPQGRGAFYASLSTERECKPPAAEKTNEKLR